MEISLVRVLTLEELPFEDAIKIACGEVKYFTTLFHKCELTQIDFMSLSHNLEATLVKYVSRELIKAKDLEPVLKKELSGTNFPGMPISRLGNNLGQLRLMCTLYPDAIVQVYYKREYHAD